MRGQRESALTYIIPPEWGYHGSGPAQLALAMLAEMTDGATALRYYQQLKVAVLAGIETDEWTLDYDTVLLWLNERERAEEAAADEIAG